MRRYDVLGQQTLRVFQNEGIETSYIALDNETPSGVALISVDQYAENCIVVASGANMLLGQEDIDSMEKEMLVGDILLMQQEIVKSENFAVVNFWKNKKNNNL